MNLLTIITAISALVAYITATPINNYNTTAIKNITNSKIQSNISVGVNKINNNVLIPNITTSIPSMTTTEKITKPMQCYYNSGTIGLRGGNIHIVYKKHQGLATCKPSITGCRMHIIWNNYLGNKPHIRLFTGCAYDYSKKRKFPNKAWCLNFKDYDTYDKNDNLQCSIIEDYCEGNLCNSQDLKNLPYIKKLLSIQPKTRQQHDELCPGYSKNYRKINMQHRKPQEISVVEGSNLILIAKILQNMLPVNFRTIPQILPNSNSSYDKTEWTVATLEDHDNDMPFISFDKDDNIITYSVPHKLIANNKTFFLTPKSIHICNFTKEDQGIFKHIDKLQNNQTLVYEVKIIIRKEPTTIFTTTKEPTTISTTKGDYTSTKNNNIKYIIGSVASGFILCIVTITIYCVVKNKTCKRQVAQDKDTLMLIPLN